MHARQFRKCPACLLQSMPARLLQINRHLSAQHGGSEFFQHRQYTNLPHVRERKNGQPSLPLPPLMDQQKIDQREKAKNKPKKPDAVATAHLSPFQKALADNPYAQALATTVRTCKVTNANLPSFFLTPFDLKPNPTDASQIGLVPSNLFSRSLRDAPKDPAITTSQVYLNQRENLITTLSSKDRIQGTAPRLTTERMFKEMAHLAKQAIVVDRPRGRSRSRGGPRPNLPVWRPDMHSFIKDLLQEAAMSKLAWIFKHSKTGLLVAPHDPALQQHATAACILDVRPLSSLLEARRQLSLHSDRIQKEIEWQMGEANRLIEGIRHQSDVVNNPDRLSKLTDIAAAIRIDPVRAAKAVHFGVTEFGGERIAIHHLAEMLELKQLDELRGLLVGTSLENESSLVIRKDQRTVAALMGLLRLQAYLA